MITISERRSGKVLSDAGFAATKHIGAEVAQPRVARDRDDGRRRAEASCHATCCDHIGPGGRTGEHASSRASCLAMFFASAVDTRSMRLTISGCQSGGTNPMPMPSILCEPEGPPESTADSSGSTAVMSIIGLCAQSASVTPWMECAVLTACTKAVTWPPVCDQISSPSGL